MKLATREEAFGCLFGLLGSVLGVGAALTSFARYAAEIRARDPDALICGNGAVAGTLGGLIFGGLAGAVAGMVLHRLHPPKDRIQSGPESPRRSDEAERGGRLD